MLRTAKLLPPTGLLTLGFDPTRFQTGPPACYRASWQLLGRDSHPLATTSLCWFSYSIALPTLGARTIGASLSVGPGVIVVFRFTDSPDLVSPLSRSGTRPGIRPVLSRRPDGGLALLSRHPAADAVLRVLKQLESGK
jgi:hypothetical protein